MWLHLHQLTEAIERLIGFSRRKLCCPQCFHHLRLIAERFFRRLCRRQRGFPIAKLKVIRDQSEGGSHGGRVGRNSSLDGRLYFIGRMPRHGQDLREPHQQQFVLRIFLEHAFIALAGVFRLLLLDVEHRQIACRREIGGIDLERLIEAGAGALEVVLADVHHASHVVTERVSRLLLFERGGRRECLLELAPTQVRSDKCEIGLVFRCIGCG